MTTREQRKELARLLGWRVRAARVFRGLPAGELAERAGLERSRLGRLERGTCEMEVDELVAVAQALELSLLYFLEEPASVREEACPVCGRRSRSP